MIKTIESKQERDARRKKEKRHNNLPQIIRQWCLLKLIPGNKNGAIRLEKLISNLKKNPDFSNLKEGSGNFSITWGKQGSFSNDILKRGNRLFTDIMTIN